MNSISNTLIKASVLLSLSAVVFSAVEAAELEVTIDHINNDSGKVYAQIFAGKDNYKQGKSQQSSMIQARQGAGIISFKNLSPGEYVVRMYHDANDNQKMDRNAFGMPTEGYAFSNEAVGSMGPPSYEQMVIVVAEDQKLVKTKAKMIYL